MRTLKTSLAETLSVGAGDRETGRAPACNSKGEAYDYPAII